MKKVLFLQMFGKSFGGVWQVIKLVGENLVLNDYDVSVISLSENKNNLVIEADERIKMYTINPEDGWEIQLYSDMIKQATKGHILKAVNMLYQIGTKTGGKFLVEIIRDNFVNNVWDVHRQRLVYDLPFYQG